MWPTLNNPPVGVALAQIKLNTENFSIQNVDAVDRQLKDNLADPFFKKKKKKSVPLQM